jgi:predicted alpha/beta-fold hydrolase
MDTNPLSSKTIEKNLGGALPDFAIAINPPFDLERASVRLSGGPSRIYGQNFMPALLECLEDRATWLPENERRTVLQNLAIRARKNLSIFSTVGTFDAAYTGPAAGFIDHVDYYHRASSGRYLEQTSIPLVILSADDDPITHGLADVAPDLRLRVAGHSHIVLDQQQFGGHMGYVDRATLFSPLKKHARWLENRIAMYLRAFQPLAIETKGNE